LFYQFIADINFAAWLRHATVARLTLHF